MAAYKPLRVTLISGAPSQRYLSMGCATSKPAEIMLLGSLGNRTVLLGGQLHSVLLTVAC